MEMLYWPSSVMTSPSLVQVYVVGGPPLVSQARVKVGGLDIKDEERDTGPIIAMLPRPIDKKPDDC